MTIFRHFRRSQRLPHAGDIVHYVIPYSGLYRNHGEHRPAIVVRVGGDEFVGGQRGDALVNLQWFTDLPNDIPGHSCTRHREDSIWVKNVKFDQVGKALGTWHWPGACTKTEFDFKAEIAAAKV